MESKIPFNCVHICITDCHQSNCGEIQSYDVQYLEMLSVELLVIIEFVVRYSYDVQYLERLSVELLVVIETVASYGVQYLQRLSE